MARINTSQRVRVSVEFKNERGEAATVQGEPNWAASDETIVSVEPEAGGMSAYVNSVAPSPDAARITVSADADMGAGVKELVGVSEDIFVDKDPSNEASVISFTFGSPEPKAVGPAARGRVNPNALAGRMAGGRDPSPGTTGADPRGPTPGNPTAAVPHASRDSSPNASPTSGTAVNPDMQTLERSRAAPNAPSAPNPTPAGTRHTR